MDMKILLIIPDQENRGGGNKNLSDIFVPSTTKMLLLIISNLYSNTFSIILKKSVLQ